MKILMRLTGVEFLLKKYTKGIKNNPNPYPSEVLEKKLEGHPEIVIAQDGARIHAISKGQGETVILANGYGVDKNEWNIVAKLLLKKGYRVIAFDLRGHGESTIGKDSITSQSMVDDYHAVLEHFDVQNGILAGHSTGGFLSILFLLNHQEKALARLKGAVIIAGLAGDILKGNLQNRLQLPLIRLGWLQKLMASDAFSWYFGASLCGKKPFPAAITAFNNSFLRQDHYKLIPILKFLAKESYYDRLGEIQTPCVIICGEDDKTTPRWHSEKMGSDIPNARNVWVKDMGHLLNWEAPEVIVESVESLKSI